MFTIDPIEKTITYQDARIPSALNFTSQEGLASFAADKGWGKEWLTDLWNSFAGVVPFDDCKQQKCFKNRNYAVERIWIAIQRLANPAKGASTKPTPQTDVPKQAVDDAPAISNQNNTETTVATKTKKIKKTATKAKKTPKTPKTKNTTEAPKTRANPKQSDAIALMRRPEGVTATELQTLLGWQPHSLRGFVAGTLKKKLGLNVESFKPEGGERSYRIV